MPNVADVFCGEFLGMFTFRNDVIDVCYNEPPSCTHDVSLRYRKCTLHGDEVTALFVDRPDAGM
jgi:hypothetical protein